MKSPLLALALAVLALPARADFTQTAEALSAEIAQARADLEAGHGYYGAGPSMAAVFAEHGIGWSQRYIEAWGGWHYLDWNSALPFYLAAAEDIRLWQHAVATGQAEGAGAEAALLAARPAFREAHAEVARLLVADLHRSARRAWWMDRAQAIWAANDGHLTEPQRALVDRYGQMAEHAVTPGWRPLYDQIGVLRVFPAAPGQPARDGTAPLEALIRSAFPESGDIRTDALAAALLHLRLSQGPDGNAALDLLRRVEEAARQEQTRPIQPLLQLADSLPPGPERDEALRDAALAIAERYGTVAPDLAAAANAGRVEDRIDAAHRLLQAAQQGRQLWEDLHSPGEAPGALLRLVSGLKAAVQILDPSGGAAESVETLSRSISDLATAMPTPVSPVAPFAAPMGIVTGQLSNTQRAFTHASNALEAVTRAMDGDPNALARARAEAEALRATLSPRQILADAGAGLRDGILSNVPGARAIYDWWRSA